MQNDNEINRQESAEADIMTMAGLYVHPTGLCSKTLKNCRPFQICELSYLHTYMHTYIFKSDIKQQFFLNYK